MRNKIFIMLILVISSCGLEEDITLRDYPYLNMLGLTSLNDTGVTVDFEILKEGKVPISSYGVEYVNGPEFSHESIFSEKTGKPNSRKISYRLETDLILGVTYTIRPFIKAGDLVVYGKKATFTSRGGRPPLVHSISSNILSGDTEFTINGAYFSTLPNGNKVEILGLEQTYSSQVIFSSHTELKVRATRTTRPLEGGTHKYSVRVTSNQKAVTVFSHFTISNPYIEDVLPLKGHVGSMVSLKVRLNSADPSSLFFPYHFATFTPSSNPGFFEGEVRNVHPGIYPIVISNGDFRYTYHNNYEVLNSWKVFKLGISGMQTPFTNRKFVIGDRILKIGEGGDPSIYYYNFKTEEVTKLRDQEGPFLRRSASISAVDGDRYYYSGLGFRYITNDIEDLKDFRRLNLVTNEWEVLPDLPLERSLVSKGFEYGQKITVVLDHYLNYFYFDPLTMEWQDSKSPVPSQFRSSHSYCVDGNEIYFLWQGSLYRHRIGFETILITELGAISHSGARMVKKKDQILIAVGTTDIYLINLVTQKTRRVQSLFAELTPYIFPFVSEDNFLLGFPKNHFDPKEKNIIYELDLEN